MRLGNLAYREEEKNEILNKITEAKSQEAYFKDVIKYYQAKTNFYDVVEPNLDFTNAEDYDFYMQIQPAREELWNKLDELNIQLVEVQGQIGDL
jgi:hypothetical protein